MTDGDSIRNILWSRLLMDFDEIWIVYGLRTVGSKKEFGGAFQRTTLI